MATSNTEECFRECVGKKVVGVLFDAMPPGRHDLRTGTKTLLFDDGSGLTISGIGSFCVEHPEDINRAIAEVHGDLCRNQRALKDVLVAAGAHLPGRRGAGGGQ